MGNKSITKNLTYQSIYNLLNLLLPLVMTPYLSRTLGVEMLGTFSYITSIINYFVMIACLGIDNYGCRSIAQINESNSRSLIKKVFWEIYSVQLVTGGFSVLLFLAFYTLFIKDNGLLFLIQGITILSFTIDTSWFFFGTEQFSLTAKISCFFRTLTLLSVLIFVRSKDDLSKYMLIMVLSLLINHLVLWFLLLKQIGVGKLDFHNFKRHMSADLALFIPVIAVSIYHTMDKTMLGKLSDFYNSGLYYNADKLINIPLGLITGLSVVMMPRMSNILYKDGNQKGKEFIGKSFELTFFLAVSIAFGIAAISKEFVPWFFGSEFYGCVELIYVFAPILAIKAISSLIQTQYLIPNSNERVYTISVFIGAVFNLVLNYILIPLYGALGATVATFVAEFLVCISEMFALRKDVDFFRMILSNSIYICIGFIMYLCVRIVANLLSVNITYKILIEIIVGVLIYIIGSFIYWVIHPNSIFNVFLRDMHSNNS